MQADIETSLRNLRTSYIDLYQVHNPSMEDLAVVTGPGGALEALQQAKKEGKIGHIGLTAHSLEVFEKALSLPWVETIMFPYNLVETQGEALIHRCREKNIGFIAMKPLAGGALTRVPGETEDRAVLALRFLAQNPDVTVVIPGMYCKEEVERNAAALLDTAPLTDTEQEKIQQIRQELGQNFCRRCNYCAPCTKGISIPNVFLFEGYLTRYGLVNWARERYELPGSESGGLYRLRRVRNPLSVSLTHSQDDGQSGGRIRRISGEKRRRMGESLTMSPFFRYHKNEFLRKRRDDHGRRKALFCELAYRARNRRRQLWPCL